MIDDVNQNDTLATGKWAKTDVLKLRDREHEDAAKRTRPERCGSGRKLGPRPSLEDYDNR